MHRYKKQENLAYPSTKTPVPNRKNKAREAPKMSPILSGLTPNLLGSGGLKLGGGAKVKDPSFSSSLALTEVELSGLSDEDDPDAARIDSDVVLGLRREEES